MKWGYGTSIASNGHHFLFEGGRGNLPLEHLLGIEDAQDNVPAEIFNQYLIIFLPRS